MNQLFEKIAELESNAEDMTFIVMGNQYWTKYDSKETTLTPGEARLLLDILNR